MTAGGQLSVTDELAAAGLAIPGISLPSAACDMAKWPALACDQFTQDRAFWEARAAEVGEAPSALKLMLPEVYLEDAGCPRRVAAIHETMRRYTQEKPGVFDPARQAAVFVERATAAGTRRGLLLAIDLEHYDWRPGAKSLIRASEGTIRERLPARTQIRRNAPLELPHVILLMNDEDDFFFPMIEKLIRHAPFAYDTPLPAGGGSVRGRLLCRRSDWRLIAGFFTRALREARAAYGEENAFLFATGDGNHSLAAAKAVWEEYKAGAAVKTGPDRRLFRWALVEIENIFDKALVFEPIHRLLLDSDPAAVLEALKALPDFSCREVPSVPALRALVAEAGAPRTRYGFFTKDRALLLESAGTQVATVALEPLVERALLKSGGVADYIHGARELEAAARANARRGACGILLPPFDRARLFKTVAESGPLPRKSFSMGEAREKRYYLESRLLHAE